MTTNFVRPDPAFAHRYCSVNQAAGALGLSPAAITKMIKLGQLPAYRAGRRVLLRVVDVESRIEPYTAPRPHRTASKEETPASAATCR